VAEQDPTPEEVGRVWADRWRQSPFAGGTSLEARLASLYARALRGGIGPRRVTEEVERAAGSLAGLRVLEPDTGTGLLAAAVARKGARTTILDMSEKALAIAAGTFEQAGLEAEAAVLGSVFELPFPDASFDVVFNSGLLEHFERERRRAALDEMLRVLAADGVCVTFNPNARARLYRRLKDAAERRGSWDVGVELPIETLADVVDLERYELREHSFGVFMQLHFLKYVLPRPIGLAAGVVGELLETALGRLVRSPGYLLVSVIRPRPVSESPPPPATSPARRGARSSGARSASRA
jgi:ubiquinone/menaquinone biosynthesis C-methylase UbiE